MRLNERQIRWMIENDLILRENHELDGSLGKIWSGMKGPLKDFGTVLKSSVKLIGVDLGFLVKLTVGSILLPSASDIDEWSREKKQKRNQLLQQISAGASWDNMDGNAKLMGFMLNPAGFMLTKAGMFNQFDLPNLRGELGEMGFDSLPGPLGWIFDKDLKFESDTWACMKRAEDDEGVDRCMANAIDSLTGGTKRTTGLGISDAVVALTGIYAFVSESVTPSKRLIEGSEDDSDEIPKDVVPLMMGAVERLLKQEFQVPEEDLLKMKEKELKRYMANMPKVLTLLTTMAGTTEVPTFFKSVEKLMKELPDSSKAGGVDQLQSGFEKMKDTLKGDSASMDKLKKKFEEEGEEPTEESVEREIEKVILSSFKAQFLQELKSGLTSALEKVHDEIWDGMTQKEIKLAGKTEVGKKYIELCKKYESQVDEALSKLQTT